jgi:Eukaryotic translation initiation factor 3 subunit 8 N-terminus
MTIHLIFAKRFLKIVRRYEEGRRRQGLRKEVKVQDKLQGCVLAAVERLDDEFIKLLKECDLHTNDYIERLKDEVTESKLQRPIV